MTTSIVSLSASAFRLDLASKSHTNSRLERTRDPHMASILIALLYLVLVLVSVFLIFVVLMQRANTNAGLGTAFGGGIAESAFGAETGNLLTKCTIGASIAFFIVSFSLYLIYISRSGEDDFMPGGLPEVGLIEADTQSIPAVGAVDTGELKDASGAVQEMVELADAVRESALSAGAALSDPEGNSIENPEILEVVPADGGEAPALPNTGNSP